MTWLKRHWRKLLLGVLVGFFIIVISPFLFVIGMETYGHIKCRALRIDFDAAQWRANPESDEKDPPRLRMIDSLLQKKILDGLTREQVLNLLGPKTETDKYRHYDLVYWLGPERGYIRIDSEWLVINFDGNNKVKDYKVTGD